MHEVRVHQNHDEGTRWWAESDLGFTGGADRLADLVAFIHEWAEAEGILGDLQVTLVAAQAETPTWQPERFPTPVEPPTHGTDAVRVEFLAGV